VDVLWRANEANENINFAVEPNRTISWVSRDGVVTPLTPVGGYVSITISGYPGYLRQEALPILSVTPISNMWVVQAGESPADRQAYVANAGGGTLNWTAAVIAGGAYFSVQPASGTAPAMLTIQAQPQSIGLYTGTVEINGGSAGVAYVGLSMWAVPATWKTYLPLVGVDND
jgi:hypothetical protein